MTVRALYAWEMVRDGAVRERGSLAEGGCVIVGPTGLAREGQGPILPWHARLAVAGGRLLAASADVRNPAMLGSMRLPADFSSIEVPNAVRVGAFELRISATAPEEAAPETSRTGEDATLVGRVDETLVGRASGAVPAVAAPVPATTREPSLAPFPARRSSGEVSAVRQPAPVFPAREPELPSHDADRSMMTRLGPVELAARPDGAPARVARKGLRDSRAVAHVAHAPGNAVRALGASGSSPVAVSRMSEHPPTALPVRPLTASGEGPIAAPGPTTPPQGVPAPPHANAYATPTPNAYATPTPNAYATPTPNAYATPHANVPPAPWTAPTSATPPQAWVAAPARTAPPPAPPTARPRRVVVAIAAGGLAAAAILFGLSGLRRPPLATTKPAAAETTLASTGPTFRRVEPAPPATAAPSAPAPAPTSTTARTATSTAPAVRDAVAERRIAKALLAGDASAATTEAAALAAAHPEVAEYRTMRRALRRMTPPASLE